MITIYNSTESNFEHDGLGVLDRCISCIVTREINAVWSAELEVTMLSKKVNRIIEHSILQIPTPSGLQLFRVKEIERNLDSIFIYSTHVFFDLADNFIVDTNIVAKTRGYAIEQLLDRAVNKHNFKYVGTDVTELNNARIVRKNVVDAIIGSDENCIFQRWNGGELEIDNFNISSKDQIGSYTDFEINYSKNMTGITEVIDATEVVTRILPQGANELLLPEIFVDSKRMDSYHQPLIKHIEFNNIRVVTPEDAGEDGEVITEEQAHNMLRQEVEKLYSNGVDLPKLTYEISFVDLRNTKQYSKFKFIHNLNLGDTVIVNNSEMGIRNLECRIRSYQYNSLTGEFEVLKVGTELRKLSQQIKGTEATIIENNKNVINQVNSIDSKLNNQISNSNDNLTKRIIALEGTVTDTANNLNTKIDNTKSELQNETDTKINEAKTELESYTDTKVNDTKRELQADINNKVDEAGVKDVIDKSSLLRLTHSEAFNVNGEITINLPQEFMGRTFMAFTTATNTMATDPLISQGFMLDILRTDTQTGQIVISGSKTLKNLDTGDSTVEEVQGRLIVIS